VVPSLVKKLLRGRAYYYLAYSARVNGKPRIVRQVYLGSATQVAQRLAEQAEPTTAPLGSYTVLREVGASTALWALVRELGLVELIDAEVGRTRSDLSVGQYLALAAINRCITPTSKKAMKDWYARSYLSSLLPARPRVLEGQRFWDAMSRVHEKHISAIEERLLIKVRDLFGIDLHNVMYDATNFFTYINTQTESDLAQRGHNKAKRDDLRQVSLAVLASLDCGVPLFHHCYPGQVHDATEFANVLDRMVKRLKSLGGSVDVTIVFDKGNNSEANFKRLDEVRLSTGLDRLHYVGSLPAVVKHLPAKNLRTVDGVLDA
jgi:transposase